MTLTTRNQTLSVLRNLSPTLMECQYNIKKVANFDYSKPRNQTLSVLRY